MLGALVLLTMYGVAVMGFFYLLLFRPIIQQKRHFRAKRNETNVAANSRSKKTDGRSDENQTLVQEFRGVAVYFHYIVCGVLFVSSLGLAPQWAHQTSYGIVRYIFFSRNRVVQVVYVMLYIGGTALCIVYFFPVLMGSHAVVQRNPDGTEPIQKRMASGSETPQPSVERITPTVEDHVLVYVTATMIAWMGLSYLVCALSDPGIIRTEKAAAAYARTHYLHDDLLYPSPALTCSTCGIPKPPRSFHCDLCGHCVVKFDHHCSWVNNDIGARNMRYFLHFLVAHTSGLTLMTLMTIRVLLIYELSFHRLWKQIEHSSASVPELRRHLNSNGRLSIRMKLGVMLNVSSLYVEFFGGFFFVILTAAMFIFYFYHMYRLTQNLTPAEARRVSLLTTYAKQCVNQYTAHTACSVNKQQRQGLIKKTQARSASATAANASQRAGKKIRIAPDEEKNASAEKSEERHEAVPLHVFDLSYTISNTNKSFADDSVEVIQVSNVDPPYFLTFPLTLEQKRILRRCAEDNGRGLRQTYSCGLLSIMEDVMFPPSVST